MNTTTTKPSLLDKLQNRDTRIASELKRMINENQELAYQLQAEAQECLKQASDIQKAVREGRWFDLPLSEADIESLCNISPSNLLGD